ncbi:uncharacterized protein N7498_010382 [Penicillium cinerascens]|uniref:FAD/NAD(P)-binding domain-containing protein n=1 Tax=Penicillium cinerascens TaxID=70096 RepID=A0A9W9J8C9_9EURO|nr:uncharacterized protein N7498_010382 [Penicillium cinerascens]KAJ5191397.1 hypothetical protein N7498_010382 [Penicillium cinerascens]
MLSSAPLIGAPHAGSGRFTEPAVLRFIPISAFPRSSAVISELPRDYLYKATRVLWEVCMGRRYGDLNGIAGLDSEVCLTVGLVGLVAISVNTDVLTIGAGPSGIAFAVQLQKQFPGARYEILERTDNLGGLWWVNTYPGCGCDVASHFYSFSFALNPNWSRKFASQQEIAAYLHDVVEQNDVPSHVRCLATVQSAAFDETSGTWVATMLDSVSGEVSQRRSKILISAVGAQRECEIQGAEIFKGKLFHSAQWDHSFDWAGKDVVYRLYLYAMMEKDFLGFYQETGSSIREDLKRAQIEYMKKNAAERYHDGLLPRMETGCKGKVMETNYLACLRRENVELVHSDPIEEVTETGVRTRSGAEVHADAIILANGFQTQQVLFPREITAAKVLVRLSTGLLRNLRLRVPHPLHPHGSQYYHGSPVGSFLDRVRNQFHAANSASNPECTLSARDLIGTHLSIRASSIPSTGHCRRDTRCRADIQQLDPGSIFEPPKREFVFGRSPVQVPAKDTKKDDPSGQLDPACSVFAVVGVAVVVGLMVHGSMDMSAVEIAKGLRDAVTRVQSECVTGLRSRPILAGWKGSVK